MLPHVFGELVQQGWAYIGQLQVVKFKQTQRILKAHILLYNKILNVRPIAHLVQLPAETLKNVMLVDLENRFAFIEYSVHDHTEGVHVGGRVAADGQYVLRGQVLGVREAQRRKVRFPFFTCVLGL